MYSEEKLRMLREKWEEEEKTAHISGWDFSHINDRYDEEDDLSWDYRQIIKEHLRDDMKLLDYDTGGGEFLLSLNHPYSNTAATEGYPPNVDICRERLLPLGIDFRVCDDCSAIPFNDCSFDMVIDRHGDLNPKEIFRILKSGGIVITEQVGNLNDRDLVETVLPGTPLPFPENDLSRCRNSFIDAGFEMIRDENHFGAINFYDVGAFVWFAHIIEWEFPGFSVDRCFDKLLYMQRDVELLGRIEGTTHRFLIVARKPL